MVSPCENIFGNECVCLEIVRAFLLPKEKAGDLFIVIVHARKGDCCNGLVLY